MIPTAEHLAAFLGHLDARDARAATDLAVDLALRGASLPDLFARLIGPAQAEVGRRWSQDAYSVADEHAATAIVDAVVAVLATQVPPQASGGPRVALTCPEGEWHVLPARLTAEVLRWGGCPTTFLGGSLPAHHLARFLAATPVDVVAVSCTTPLALPGVLASVEVAHAAGLPVLAGGRALGPDGRRARTLGADLWAPDAQTALDLLAAPLPVELATSTAAVADAEAIAAARDELVDRAVAVLEAGPADYASYDDAQRARTAEDLGYLVEVAAAALLVGDPTVFTDLVVWLDEVLVHRGVPAGTLERSLALLEAADGPAALAALLAEGRRRLVG